MRNFNILWFCNLTKAVCPVLGFTFFTFFANALYRVAVSISGLHIPLKSGSPESVLIPAPVNATRCLEEMIHSAAVVIFSLYEILVPLSKSNVFLNNYY